MTWHLEEYEGEKCRLVVSANNVLIADMYAINYGDYGVPSPEEYVRNAQLVALMPRMVLTLLSLDERNLVGGEEEIIAGGMSLVQRIREINKEFEDSL